MKYHSVIGTPFFSWWLIAASGSLGKPAIIHSGVFDSGFPKAHSIAASV